MSLFVVGRFRDVQIPLYMDKKRKSVFFYRFMDKTYRKVHYFL